MGRLSIDPPVRGEWKAIHNPGDTPHALDFIGLRTGKRLPYPLRSLLAHLFYRTPAKNAFGWDRPVYATFDGEVTEARDGYPDGTDLNLVRDVLRHFVFLPDIDQNVQRFAGNYAVIEGAEAVAFMAHLQCDSVRVTAGDRVIAGEQIGTIGNSGASLIPHLHFQLLNEWPSLVSNITEHDRPFRFHQYDRWTAGGWRTMTDRGPKSGDRIRVTN